MSRRRHGAAESEERGVRGPSPHRRRVLPDPRRPGRAAAPAREPLPRLRRGVLPAPAGVRQVPARGHRGHRAVDPRHDPHLDLLPRPALRQVGRRRRRLRRGPGRPARGAPGAVDPLGRPRRLRHRHGGRDRPRDAAPEQGRRRRGDLPVPPRRCRRTRRRGRSRSRRTAPREARPEVRRRRRRRHRHGPLRHVQGHPGRAPGPRRRTVGAARRRHDAGRRRRGVRGLHPAGLDARHQGHEGVRPDRAARHPHRERVGHRARRLPRGGVGRVVGAGRRGHGAVLRQVHRHDRHRRPRRGPRPDRRADPARRLLRALGAAPHARPGHDARELRHHRGQELELRRGLPVRPPSLRPRT